MARLARYFAAQMRADRLASISVSEVADTYGFSKITVWRHTRGVYEPQKPDLARYRKIVIANASPDADRDAIAARFGLANKRVLSVIVVRGRNFLNNSEH